VTDPLISFNKGIFTGFPEKAPLRSTICSFPEILENFSAKTTGFP
jgi:hypothetical protein